MLISKAIPHLANGISQQPPTLRLASQAQSQENCYSSVVEGLKKRPPTQHVAKIINGTMAEAFLHTINRDTAERYKVIILDGSIKVFDLNGVEKTVNIAQSDGYLEADTPASSFRAVTIADYTIVANAEKIVRVGDIDAAASSGATQYLLQVANHTVNTVYHVYLDLPTGTTSNTGNNTWNGTPLEFDYTVGTNTNSQVATGLNAKMLSEGAARNISEFIGSYTESDVWFVAPKRDESTPFNQAQEFPRLDMRVTVNSTVIPVRDTGTAPSPLVTFPTGDADLFSRTDTVTSLVFVKQGNYGMAYTVSLLTFDGVEIGTVTKTTSNSDVTDISTSKIATDLKALLVANTAINTQFTLIQSGSLIKIISKAFPSGSGPSGTIYRYAIATADGNGNKNMVGIKDQTQKFSNLPENCFDGFQVRIAGDAQSGTDDYYVTFDGGAYNLATEGQWIESAKDQPSSIYLPETMPHTLVRQADGTFIFGQADWIARPSGDADSNPAASFVDNTIDDLFFYRNRLGFLSDDNYILSCAGDYFNFWRTTVQTILDGDVIDLAVSSTKVPLLRHAIPFAKKLVLFSDLEQFVCNPGDLLTVKTANAQPSTAYEVVKEAKPVVAGSAIYFCTPRGEFVGMREYAVDKVKTDEDDAGNITAHVPSYIPAGAFRIFTASEESILGVLTTGEPSRIYVYKWFLTPEGDKLQSSWSHWDFGADATILDAAFINLNCFAVVQRVDGVYLETFSVETDRRDTDMEYEVLLDRRVTNTVATAAYNSTTNVTTWTLPYADASDDLVIVVRPGGVLDSGDEIESGRPSNTTINATSNLATQPVYIGRKYTGEYEFSEAVPKEKAGSGSGDGAPVLGGRLQVKWYRVTYDRTGFFEMVVQPRGEDDYTYTSTFSAGPTIGSETEIGVDSLRKGTFTVPVHSKSDRVTIKILSDSWRPFRIQSAEWEGNFSIRSRRM